MIMVELEMGNNEVEVNIPFIEIGIEAGDVSGFKGATTDVLVKGQNLRQDSFISTPDVKTVFANPQNVEIWICTDWYDNHNVYHQVTGWDRRNVEGFFKSVADCAHAAADFEGTYRLSYGSNPCGSNYDETGQVFATCMAMLTNYWWD
jgi:hypothetical protein